MVGDHPINDMQGAHDVGMQTCWMHQGQTWPITGWEPDLRVQSLNELLGVLL